MKDLLVLIKLDRKEDRGLDLTIIVFLHCVKNKSKMIILIYLCLLGKFYCPNGGLNGNGKIQTTYNKL